MNSLLLRNVRPLGADPTDLLVIDGRIASGTASPGIPSLDGGGRLLLPGLVEAHTHLDKSLLGMPWYRNEVGPRLIDKIDNERAVRRTLPIPPQRQSARQVKRAIGHGVTHIRSHVDVDTECGVSGIEGVLATREAGGPYGNADMLERATLLGLRNNLRRDDELRLALDAVTVNGAAAIGLSGYGMSPGDAADFVLVDAETVAEAVAQHPAGRTTIKAGRVVAEGGVASTAIA